MNKYLVDNPIPWLLDMGDPHIRYLTMRDILGHDIQTEEMLCEYEYLKKSEAVKEILRMQRKGILGDTKNYDLYYRGAIWYFALAVEHGLDMREESLRNTAEFILSICQLDSGGFTFNWKPETAVACRTGDMIRYLILSGCRDDRIEWGVEWIVKNQRHDGGWLHCPVSGICDMVKLVLFKRPGSGLERESSVNVQSCFFATIACSMALVMFSEKYNNKYDDSIKRASEFFLRNRLIGNKETRLHRIRHGGNRKDFILLGYPVLSQYDILYCLIFLGRAGCFSDSRLGEAYNTVISRQNSDGTWNMENARTGMLYGDRRKKRFIGKRSKWVTLNVLRMFRASGMEI